MPLAVQKALQQCVRVIAIDDGVAPTLAFASKLPKQDLPAGVQIGGDACRYPEGGVWKVGLGGYIQDGRWWHVMLTYASERACPPIHVWEILTEGLNLLLFGRDNPEGTRLQSWIDNAGMAFVVVRGLTKDARVQKASLFRQVVMPAVHVECVETVWVNTLDNELADATSHGHPIRDASKGGVAKANHNPENGG